MDPRVKKILEKRAGVKTPSPVVKEVDGREVAAQDLISALGEKSPQKLMKALGNFQDLHSYKPAKE